MKAKEMVCGCLYAENGRVINLHFIGPKYAIVSMPGEIDMQSQWGIPIDSDVVEVRRTSTTGKCPFCDSEIEPAVNPDNPEVRRWSHWCTGDKCGWLGNVKKEQE